MTIGKPLFSIVMANFNHGKYLDEAILSILNQNCQDFELIVVDGGSTDDSVKIIEKYADRLSWWVSEKDKGQSDAFNKGFSKAKGRFYFWINADDLLLPGSLEYAKIAIYKHPSYKWFTANTIFVSRDGKIKKCAKGPQWKAFMFKKAPITVYGPTAIFHKSVFNELLGFDESLNYTMDTDLWMRFKNYGLKYKRIEKYFWVFRMHEESKTSHVFTGKANPSYLKERQKIIEKNNQKYTQTGVMLQRLFKLFSGLYVCSWLDTMKLKDKHISFVKKMI